MNPSKTLLAALLVLMLGRTAPDPAPSNIFPPTATPMPTITPLPTITPVPTPSATPQGMPDRVLSRGMFGEDVRLLQRRLIELGYLVDVADGIYGKNTEDAVKLFQFYHDLDQDGIAGMQTLTRLFSDNVVYAPPRVTPSPSPTPTPTPSPTPRPTRSPRPTATPTQAPTATPVVTTAPTAAPTATLEPTASPTPSPTEAPTPSPEPTLAPTEAPTPSPEPTAVPTEAPTPSPEPTAVPTEAPTPSPEPTAVPTEAPTPSPEPTAVPTEAPTPSPEPTEEPTPAPTETPAPSLIEVAGVAVNYNGVDVLTSVFQNENGDLYLPMAQLAMNIGLTYTPVSETQFEIIKGSETITVTYVLLTDGTLSQMIYTSDADPTMRYYDDSLPTARVKDGALYVPEAFVNYVMGYTLAQNGGGYTLTDGFTPGP